MEITRYYADRRALRDKLGAVDDIGPGVDGLLLKDYPIRGDAAAYEVFLHAVCLGTGFVVALSAAYDAEGAGTVLEVLYSGVETVLKDHTGAVFTHLGTENKYIVKSGSRFLVIGREDKTDQNGCQYDTAQENGTECYKKPLGEMTEKTGEYADPENNKEKPEYIPEKEKLRA